MIIKLTPVPKKRRRHKLMNYSLNDKANNNNYYIYYHYYRKKKHKAGIKIRKEKKKDEVKEESEILYNIYK